MDEQRSDKQTSKESLLVGHGGAFFRISGKIS